MSQASSPSSVIASNGMYLDVGGLWVRYDTIGTVKDTSLDGGEPACLVVLTITGYKTLRVGCSAAELLTAIDLRQQAHEQKVGLDRAKGMRWENR